MSKLDRIQVAMLGLTFVAAIGAGLWRGLPWGAGAFCGGIVGYLNFRWLRATVERLVKGGGGIIAFTYMFKLTLLTAVLAGLVFGLNMPALAVLLGIGAMPLGIVLELAWSSVAPLPADPSA